MKKLAILLALMAFSNVNAQEFNKHLLYAKIGLSGGNHLGAHLSINYIHNEKYSFELGGSFLAKRAKDTPDDYRSEGFFFFGQRSTQRPNKVESLDFLAGKIIFLNTKKKIRLNLKRGLAYSRITKAVNWRLYKSGWFGPNYTFDYDKDYVVSTIINPDFEFVYSKVIGFSISPFVIINNKSTAFGIGLNAIIGKVRF